MPRTNDAVDAVVVGAGIAGCAAAIGLARAGRTVALVERSSAADSYKKICTHSIHHRSIAAIRRIGAGLYERMLAAGAGRTTLSFRTPWGWIDPEPDAPAGLNLRRQVLDPLLRELVREHPTIRFLPGRRVVDLVEREGRIIGVRTEGDGAAPDEVLGRVVVAADGHGSRIAKLVEAPERFGDHHRFTYIGYYRDVPERAASTSQSWIFPGRALYRLGTDSGLSAMAVMLPADALPAFQIDAEAAFRAAWASLPDTPDLSGATRVGDFVPLLRFRNIARSPVHRGVPFVGDAALTSDYLWGAGCGFAFESAALLVDELEPALSSHAATERALARYANQHHAMFRWHVLHKFDFSRRPDYRVAEALLLRGARHDRELRRLAHDIMTSTRDLSAVLRPGTLARALWSGARA